MFAIESKILYGEKKKSIKWKLHSIFLPFLSLRSIPIRMKIRENEISSRCRLWFHYYTASHSVFQLQIECKNIALVFENFLFSSYLLLAQNFHFNFFHMASTPTQTHTLNAALQNAHRSTLSPQIKWKVYGFCGKYHFHKHKYNSKSNFRQFSYTMFFSDARAKWFCMLKLFQTIKFCKWPFLHRFDMAENPIHYSGWTKHIQSIFPLSWMFWIQCL